MTVKEFYNIQDVKAIYDLLNRILHRSKIKLNDITRKTSKNQKKKGSNATKFVLRTGGEIDL